MESTPRYIIKASEARVLRPQALKVVGLCALFYGGVWVNAFLLGWDIPSVVNLLIFIILGVLIILELIMQFLKTKKTKIELYIDRMIVKTNKDEDTIMWGQASPPNIEMNALDKIFGTATLDIGSSNMSYVKHPEQMQQYIEQYRRYGVYYAQYAAQQATQNVKKCTTIIPVRVRESATEAEIFFHGKLFHSYSPQHSGHT